MSRTWVLEAIAKIERDFARSADTHLMPLEIPGATDVTVYLKDETTHITGSLKHRLARSLFLHALCSGLVHDHTTIVEASSGSTAISEAYFARLLGLPFVAVVPRNTACAKIEAIRFYGGTCHFVEESGEVYDVARRLADECDGHYMDQFTNAAQATDWRGNNNIAESIFRQMGREAHPIPEWVVVGAGTGGTSATLGRYVRYAGFRTQICVVDPERSVFYESFYGPDAEPASDECPGTCIEGIGRPRLEPSFIPNVVDRMIRVPNAASFAASLFLDTVIGRKYGGSTGTNLYGVLQIAAELHEQGIKGSIVTLACDAGERYADTFYDPAWLRDHNVNVTPYLNQIQDFYETGTWHPVRKDAPIPAR